MSDNGVDKPKVLVGLLPERNGVPSVEILFDLIAIAQRGHAFVRTQYARTDLQRNKLAEHLLSTDYTHLLMLDADHRHPDNIVERLSRWVERDPSRLVVAGLAFRRGQPYDPQAYIMRDGKPMQPAEFKPGLAKVDFVGTAAMLINRVVFERLPKPWFAFDYRGANAGTWPGEDIWFCTSCMEAGIQVYCDMSCVSPHLAEAWIDQKTFETFREMTLDLAEKSVTLTEADLKECEV